MSVFLTAAISLDFVSKFILDCAMFCDLDLEGQSSPLAAQLVDKYFVLEDEEDREAAHQ